MTIISLEMTSPSQLIPARPAPLVLDEVHNAALVRSLYQRMFPSPGGRSAWSVDQWAEELSLPGIRTWTVRLEDNSSAIGFAELSPEPTGGVGIVVFGLVPEVRSKGYGGAFLTLITQTAWRLNSPTTRVWLQTSTRDHPHALPNYQSRGFHLFTP
ncbi:GNAT family N-acetyltransferase [Kribbella sp. NPDC055071]